VSKLGEWLKSKRILEKAGSFYQVMLLEREMDLAPRLEGGRSSGLSAILPKKLCKTEVVAHFHILEP
jgi:hypothetical protein